MIGVLTKLWHAVEDIWFYVTHVVAYLKYVGIIVINAWIQGLADFVNAVIGLMPNFPTPPSEPSWFTDTAGWVAWFWPVDQVVLIIGVILTASLAWFVVSIALRWAKVVE